jgi:hypothetical protein
MKSTYAGPNYYDETDIAPFRVRTEAVHPSVKHPLASLDQKKPVASISNPSIEMNKPPKPKPPMESSVSSTLLESLLGSNKPPIQQSIDDENKNKLPTLSKGLKETGHVSIPSMKQERAKFVYEDEFASLYSTVNKDSRTLMSNSDTLSSPTISMSEQSASQHNTFSTISRLVSAPSNNFNVNSNKLDFTRSVDFKENQRPQNLSNNLLAKSVADASSLVEAFTAPEHSSKSPANSQLSEHTSDDDEEDTSDKTSYGITSLVKPFGKQSSNFSILILSPNFLNVCNNYGIRFGCILRHSHSTIILRSK